MPTKKKAAPKKKMTVDLSKLPEGTKRLAEVITALTIIGAAVVAGCSWISSKITASTNEKLDNISSQVSSIELGATRTQLLTLMSNYPDNESEILKVAQYYFGDLDGDWYMTELFSKWATDRGIDPNTIINSKKGK